VDNNAFTNRMVQWHLQTALDVFDWLEENHPQRARMLAEALDLTPGHLAHWQDVIDHLYVAQDPATGLIHQFDGFFERRPVDPDLMANANKSMQVILGIHGANQSQVIKQADVIMLLCLLRDDYPDPRVWQVNWETYMPRTDHRYGSSLGPSIHAWAACELGRPEEAYRHFALAALADLEDVRGNAKDGIHGASAGGLWQAAAFGFGGLRIDADGYHFRPCLPGHWKRLAFQFRYHGRPVAVNIMNKGGDVDIKTREGSILKESRQPNGGAA
jgi:kojibiose phosphorylase